MGGGRSYNEVVKFDHPGHEAVMGVWWVGQLLKKQARRFFNQYLSSEVQFNIMLLLKYSDHPLSQRELSEQLLVDKSNLTGVAGRMESAGLLTRRTAAGDARTYQLELTALGAGILERLEGPYYAEIGRLMAEFTPEEQRLLTGFMARMQRALERDGEERP